MPRSQALQPSYAPDARVDTYIESAAPFAQPLLVHLRELLHTAVPGVQEAIKWSMPFFLYKGIILANMAAFKAHCSFRVWSHGLHPTAKGTQEEQAEGVFDRLTNLGDLPSPKHLRTLLLEAALKIDRGERTKNWEGRAKKDRPDAAIPEALQRALNQDTAAANHFAAMSASCRREYCEWIAEAKREETRNRRVREAIAIIAQGKPRNWKYERPATLAPVGDPRSRE